MCLFCVFMFCRVLEEVDFERQFENLPKFIPEDNESLCVYFVYLCFVECWRRWTLSDSLRTCPSSSPRTTSQLPLSLRALAPSSMSTKRRRKFQILVRFHYFLWFSFVIVLFFFLRFNNNNDNSGSNNNSNNNRIVRHNSTFLQSPRCATNYLQHLSGPGAIMCKSRATHRALISVPAQLLSLTELKSHLC